MQIKIGKFSYSIQGLDNKDGTYFISLSELFDGGMITHGFICNNNIHNDEWFNNMHDNVKIFVEKCKCTLGIYEMIFEACLCELKTFEDFKVA